MPHRYAIHDSSDEDAQSSLSEPEPENGPDEIASERLEKALRDTVANVFKSGNLEELTVRRVRLTTEKALGLEEGFFKGDAAWKEKSERIIKEEAEAQEKAQEKEKEEEKEPTSEDEPAVAPRKRKVSTKQEKAPKAKPTKSTKRSTPEDSPAPKKRQKTQEVIESEESAVSAPSDDEEDDDEDEDEVRKPTKRVSAPPQKSPKKGSKPELPAEDASEESDIANKDQAQESSTSRTRDDQGASESELSVLLDEEPKPKRKRQTSTDAPAKKGKKKTAAKADPNLDPDQAEIKRLQGWLIKCGIRKMWFRELAPYDTSKAKIKHLKKMLEDAGMKGRYSLEKARQIREQRELQQDLAMVQEGARRWGTGSADEESNNDEKPKRRLARGLKNLAFLGDDDGEETD